MNAGLRSLILLAAGTVPLAASAQGVQIYGVADVGVDASNSGKGTSKRQISGGAVMAKA